MCSESRREGASPPNRERKPFHLSPRRKAGEEEPQEREEPLGQGCSAGWDRSEKG